jgi:hypothetical protein
LVERFFRDLTEFITEKSFASTRDLADAIIAFLAARNENPRRYVEGEGRGDPAQDQRRQTGTCRCGTKVTLFQRRYTSKPTQEPK